MKHTKRLGTPEVAWRAARPSTNITSSASAADMISVSTCQDQNPSPTVR
jgi:hypothetical protein